MHVFLFNNMKWQYQLSTALVLILSNVDNVCSGRSQKDAGDRETETGFATETDSTTEGGEASLSVHTYSVGRLN